MLRLGPLRHSIQIRFDNLSLRDVDLVRDVNETLRISACTSDLFEGTNSISARTRTQTTGSSEDPAKTREDPATTRRFRSMRVRAIGYESDQCMYVH